MYRKSILGILIIVLTLLGCNENSVTSISGEQEIPNEENISEEGGQQISEELRNSVRHIFTISYSMSTSELEEMVMEMIFSASEENLPNLPASLYDGDCHPLSNVRDEEDYRTYLASINFEVGEFLPATRIECDWLFNDNSLEDVPGSQTDYPDVPDGDWSVIHSPYSSNCSLVIWLMTFSEEVAGLELALSGIETERIFSGSAVDCGYVVRWDSLKTYISVEAQELEETTASQFELSDWEVSFKENTIELRPASQPQLLPELVTCLRDTHSSATSTSESAENISHNTILANCITDHDRSNVIHQLMPHLIAQFANPLLNAGSDNGRNDEIAELAVSITGTGSGNVLSAPAGISCPPNCVATISTSTSVTLMAIPTLGSEFIQWSGACAGGGACLPVLSGTIDVVAHFEKAPPQPTRSIDEDASSQCESFEKSKENLECFCQVNTEDDVCKEAEGKDEKR